MRKKVRRHLEALLQKRLRRRMERAYVARHHRKQNPLSTVTPKCSVEDCSKEAIHAEIPYCSRHCADVIVATVIAATTPYSNEE
jgi:hypothetical protein